MSVKTDSFNIRERLTNREPLYPTKYIRASLLCMISGLGCSRKMIKHENLIDITLEFMVPLLRSLFINDRYANFSVPNKREKIKLGV